MALSTPRSPRRGTPDERAHLRERLGGPGGDHPPPGFRAGRAARDPRPLPGGTGAGRVLHRRARGGRPGPGRAAPGGAGGAAGVQRARRRGPRRGRGRPRPERPRLVSGAGGSTWSRLAGLALQIEEYELQGLARQVSSAFERKATVIRIWAYEAAALDLALRQAGQPLHTVLGRAPQPLTFVVSLRLGEPPSLEPIRGRLELYPTLRFKLDPTSSWDDSLITALVDTGAVDSVDFKGLYTGTIVDQPADPDLYRRVVEAFPEAWIEDPKLTPEIDEILRPHRDRITWDASIHSVQDILALPFPPKMVNLKPSRLGGLRSLTEAYDYCEREGIGAYGGGQFELGPGRGQIQYLAAMFHPDTPNDVAPTGYNLPRPEPGLPPSPLAPASSPTGFGWGEEPA